MAALPLSKRRSVSKAVAPFFRIPGLARSDTVDSFLASQSLVTWSADVVADDWFRRITPNQIVQRAMQRLDAKGRGILLLHDIHPATAMALPSLLKQLKEHGYQVVHVVPMGELPKSVPELPASAAVANGTWPRLLHTNGTGDGNAMAISHHRVKKHVVGKISFKNITDQGSASNVRFRSKADMCSAKSHVRFTPESGHSSAPSMDRGLLYFLVGVPVPIIILLLVFFFSS